MKNFITAVGPYMKSTTNTRKMMNRLTLALIPIIIFAFLKNGILPYISGRATFYGMVFPLIFILIPALTSFLVELLYATIILKKRKSDIFRYMSTSFSIIPGLFLGLVLPINTPLTILILGAIVATIVGKLIFGGFGNNIFNPALVGVLFVVSAYGILIANNGGYLNSYEIDTISGSTPLSTVVEGIGTYDELVKPFGGFINFSVGLIPGAMGEVSSIIILIAFIYLVVTKTIKWQISVFYVATVFFMTSIIALTNNTGLWYPAFQVLSGGLLFGAVFMATDPVTSPTTTSGQIIYGIALGLLTVTFRFLTPFPEGVMTSILTMNLFVFLIDKWAGKARFDAKKLIIPFVIMGISVLAITFIISNKYQQPKDETDPNFNIVEKKVTGSKTKYVVTQKGFSSLIKIEIIFENNKITTAKVLDQNDSYFQKIIDAEYVDKLITNQNDIKNVDTISGATVSSTAVRKAFINTINDYQSNKTTVKEAPVEEKPVKTETDPNIQKEISGNRTIYTVIEKSFNGQMKLRIIVETKKIISIEIIEASDTYLNKIYSNDYLSEIILNQENLTGIDTVSGATISSTAIKAAVSKVLEAELNE